MFNTLFAKGSLMEDANMRVVNEITAAEKDCSPFLIECGEKNGWWGIWLKVDDERLLVDPCELTSSIYKDDRYYLFDKPKDEVKANEYAGHFYVDVRMENHMFEWRIGHTALSDTGRNFYTIEEYLSKTIKAITELHNVWKEGKQIGDAGIGNLGTRDSTHRHSQRDGGSLTRRIGGIIIGAALNLQSSCERSCQQTLTYGMPHLTKTKVE